MGEGAAVETRASTPDGGRAIGPEQRAPRNSRWPTMLACPSSRAASSLAVKDRSEDGQERSIRAEEAAEVASSQG